MGKTHGPTSHTHYINPNIPKILQKGERSCDLGFTWALCLQPACRSEKLVKHDQSSPKLGQGLIGPQHSPVTRPKSL
jgi:hypothetical protein